MNKRWLILSAILLIVALAFAVGCGSNTTTTTQPATGTTTASNTSTTGGAPSGEPIVFGAVVSATGPGSPLGEPERTTLQMLEKQLNAAGGLLGRPVKIVIEDDQSNPKEAVTAVNKLLQQDKVVAVIGSTISASTLAIKPIVTQAGIPQMAMAASDAITAAPIDWVWRTPPKDAIAAQRALQYIQESLKKTKVAVLYDSNAFGASGFKTLTDQAPKFGVTIVDSASYKTEDTDLTAQLTKLKGSNPEALIVWGTNPGPAVAAKNMKQLAWDIPYIGSHGIANKTFITLAGDAAEGVAFPAGKLLAPQSITDPKQKEVTDQFIAAYKEASGGQAPPTFAGHAFDAVGLLVNAIQKANSTAPADIQKELNATTGWAGPDGIYNYSATDHDGLAISDMIVVKIENGQWVLAQ